MLGGFDPRLREVFFRRRRGVATMFACLVYLASVVIAYVIAPPPEKTIDVQLEPEIQDFAVDEQEPEPEPEEEPPPPPPPDTKVKVVDKPKPKPKIKPPDKAITEAAEETSKEKTVEVGRGTPDPSGTGTGEKEPKPTKPKTEDKPKPKVEDKPKPKATPKIDPTQPIDRPENATAPKPAADNVKPTYPPALREKGITGSVLVKLHVHRDGTVRGMKVLKKSNNAATEDEKKEADALFLKAVVAAVQKWKYEPAKLSGEAITVWHKVNIPFSLTGGD